MNQTKSTVFHQSGHNNEQDIRTWLIENSDNINKTELWSWFEPQTGSILLENIHQFAKLLHPILREGLPQLPNSDEYSNLALDELRLFWPGHSLHLVSDEAGGHRWFEWSAEEKPGWKIMGGLMKTEQRLLLNNKQTLSAFYLNDKIENTPSNLKLIEYRSGQRLIAWTLTK